MNLFREKLAQASKLVAESELDAWLIFVRETANGCDSVLPLILEGSLTWQSALLLTRDGRKIAIVGNYDADPLIKSGDWDEVIPYVQSIREPLCQAIDGIHSDATLTKIGLNYSANDDKADGLSHGMFLLLQDYLREATVVFVSAEELAITLRARKTREEIRRMREAIRETDRLFKEIALFAHRRRVSERDVYNHVHLLMKESGLGFAWDPVGDPIVNSGPESMIGHGVPSETITLQEGHIFHVDLGVEKDSYCSDLQRCWYAGSYVPDDVTRALEAVNRAITAAAGALLPGTAGHLVDAAARS
ncbi:MAG: M24 family metallopeptidase, partial [Fimbriimonas sp.]